MVNGKCIVHGLYAVKELAVRIQELPIGTWTVDYKAFLEESIGTILKDYTDNSTDTVVDITVKLLAPVEDIEKTLKLVRVLGTNNMNLFDAEERLCKYDSVYDIIDTFYKVRSETYGKRKVYQEEAVSKTLHKLTHKVALKKLKIEEHEGYGYLIKMPMDSVSQEKVAELEAEHAQVTKSLEELKSTTIEMVWTRELVQLRKCIEHM